jgi:hypothetical protein
MLTRRTLMASAVAGVVGFAADGGALGLDRRSDLHFRELNGSAGPGGWRRSLGQRQRERAGDRHHGDVLVLGVR